GGTFQVLQLVGTYRPNSGAFFGFSLDDSAYVLADPLDEPRRPLVIGRTDGRFQRSLYDIASGIGPEAILLDALGELLFVADQTGKLTAHATKANVDYELADWPPDNTRSGSGAALRVVDEQRTLLLCDQGGLRRVSFDSGNTTFIDPAPCHPAEKIAAFQIK